MGIVKQNHLFRPREAEPISSKAAIERAFDRTARCECGWFGCLPEYMGHRRLRHANVQVEPSLIY